MVTYTKARQSFIEMIVLSEYSIKVSAPTIPESRFSEILASPGVTLENVGFKMKAVIALYVAVFTEHCAIMSVKYDAYSIMLQL